MGLFKNVTQKLKNASNQSQSQSSSQYRPQQGYHQNQQQAYLHQQQYYQQQPYGQQNQTVAPGTFAPPPGPPTAGKATYAAPNHPPPHVASGGAATRGQEDQLAALAKYDTVFIIDDSESMEMFEDDLRRAMGAVVSRVVAYDPDGVDVHFFNNKTHHRSKSADDIMRLLRSVPPRGSTPTASALRRVLDPYVSELENWIVEGKPVGAPKPRPLNCCVLTDGAPNRGEDPEQYLADVARRLDAGRWPPFQLGVQFIQIGQDEEATEHLRGLDDNLKSKYGVRDMVDTTLFDSSSSSSSMDQYILKSLLGGINRTIDRTQI